MLTEREILTKTEAMQLNPVALAFVGDTVYSLQLVLVTFDIGINFPPIIKFFWYGSFTYNTLGKRKWFPK